MRFGIVIMSALPGSIVGAIAGWQFVFQILMPWIGWSGPISKLVGLLLYICIFLGIGATIGTLLFVSAAFLLGILVNLFLDFLPSTGRRPLHLKTFWSDLKVEARRIIEKKQKK